MVLHIADLVSKSGHQLRSSHRCLFFWLRFPISLCALGTRVGMFKRQSRRRWTWCSFLSFEDPFFGCIQRLAGIASLGLLHRSVGWSRCKAQQPSGISSKSLNQ